MYANWIHVFHGAYGDAVIGSVADNFEFDFLPAGNAAFNQALTNGAVAQAFLYNVNQFVFVVSNTAASAAQGVSGTNDKGITNLTTKFTSSHDGFNNGAFGNGLMDFFHCFFEQLAVLATFNSADLSAQKFYIVICQDALFFQSHSQVQANLTAQGCQKGIGTFTFDNVL